MSDQFQFSYIAESSEGVTPNSALQALPMTGGGTFGVNPQATESQRLRSDAQHPGDIITGYEPFASLPFELEPAAFDELLEGALRADATWSTAVNISDTDISFAASDDSINSAGSGFTGVTVGHKIFVGGSSEAANNGWHTVVSSTSSKIVTDSDLADDTAGDTITIKGQTIVNGSQTPTYSLQLQNLDLTNKYRSILGAKINAWALNMQLGAIITGNLGWAGLSLTTTDTAKIGNGSVTAATERNPMAEVNTFDTFVIDHTRQTYDVLGLNLAVATPTRYRKGLGNAGVNSGIGLGTLRLTGQLTVYQGNSEWALLSSMAAGTAMRLGFSLATAGGDRYFFDLPSVLMTGEPGAIPSRDTDGNFQFSFSASPGALYTGHTGAKTLQVSRVQA